MKENEIIAAILIHLLVPVAGLAWFLKLKNDMGNEKIENAPIMDLFIIFGTYGGLLIVALTTIFWEWSGMASLGAFYLILIAPVVMGLIAYNNNQRKKISKYHSWTYLSSLLYFAIAPITFVLLALVTQ
jgi:hypothetical protein